VRVRRLLLVQKKAQKKNDKTFLKYHLRVNQKKRKISSKSRKYVNQTYQLYLILLTLNKKNPTTALIKK